MENLPGNFYGYPFVPCILIEELTQYEYCYQYLYLSLKVKG